MKAGSVPNISNTTIGSVETPPPPPRISDPTTETEQKLW
jgi:hypothetical protein